MTTRKKKSRRRKKVASLSSSSCQFLMSKSLNFFVTPSSSHSPHDYIAPCMPSGSMNAKPIPRWFFDRWFSWRWARPGTRNADYKSSLFRFRVANTHRQHRITLRTAHSYGAYSRQASLKFKIAAFVFDAPWHCVAALDNGKEFCRAAQKYY